MKTTKSTIPTVLMKELGIILLSAVIFTGCNQAENEKLKQQNAQLQEELNKTETTVNSMIQIFSEVEAGLALVKEKQGMVSMDAGSPELDSKKRDKILSDIADINKLMEENKKKMFELQQQLSKSGLKFANLQKKITQLNAELESKEKDLVQLKETLVAKDFEIATLNTTVGTLTTKVVNQDSVITTQNSTLSNLDKLLNTTWFTEGTYRELKDKGIIENNGWTPWTGKKIALSENLQSNHFNEIDKRETKTIPINAKKATLVSDHPQGSYEFKKDDGGLIASLEINNPEEFWKISRYLVVEVK